MNKNTSHNIFSKDQPFQTILGIESSCDETGIAIWKHDKIVAETLHSQVETHARYGGIVPELASRDHILNLYPLTQQCLKKASLKLTDLDAIAYTQGPGLAGSLLTGSAFARTLAWQLNIQSIGIHHMEGHLLSAMLENPELDFPFLALLISGGHTLLIQAQALGNYTILGQTMDDAVGEAFDKSAKLLNLGYPGGAKLSQLATTIEQTDIQFTPPMTGQKHQHNLNFSFSGLKTAVHNELIKHSSADTTSITTQPVTTQIAASVAKAFEQTVAETLAIKTRQAIKNTNIRKLVIAGGVAANQVIRQTLTDLCLQHQTNIYIPNQRLCTDNGEMIAFAGFLNLNHHRHHSSLSFDIIPRWPLSELIETAQVQRRF